MISCWAFLVLGTPLLVAYGLATDARPAFFVLLAPVLALFSAIAHWVGAALAICLVRLFPGLDFKRLLLVITVGPAPVVVALAKAFRIQRVGPGSDGTELLVSALEGLGRTQYPLLPAYWSAEALRAAAWSALDALLERLRALPDVAPSSAGVTITPDHVIGELVRRHPATREVLRTRFGDGCFTCPGFETETRGQGAMMHGVDVGELIAELERAAGGGGGK